MIRPRRLPETLVLLLFAASSAQAIQLGILDDFEGAVPDTCDANGWTEGASSPNPPIGALFCGELETCCLVNDSSGGFGPGSRQVSFNELQWAGDYIAAGVNKIQMQAANPNVDQALFLRVGVTNENTCYVSSAAVELAPSAALEFVSFVLDEATMEAVGSNQCGGESLGDVLAGVTQLRLISAASPDFAGDAIAAQVRIDAVQSKADTDLDGVNDDLDNCTLAANADQTDTDADGIGNACDGDFDNDCAVNFVDLGQMKAGFFGDDPLLDMDNDGAVDFADLGILKAGFFIEPGPSPFSTCGACVAPPALGDNSDFGGLEMFFRGGVISDWGASPGINNFSDQTGGLYVAQFEASAGSFEYKVADTDWSIEYCRPDPLEPNVTGTLPLFGCAFPSNGMIEIPATGCYEFTMQTDGNVPPLAVDLTFTQIGD